jgi:hypothetical protein
MLSIYLIKNIFNYFKIYITFESEFGIRVLANMNSLLILCVLHVSEFFVVGVPLEQEVADLAEAVVGGVVQGRPLAHVTRIDVRTRGQQQLHTLQVPSLGCQVQRRALLLICPF